MSVATAAIIAGVGAVAGGAISAVGAGKAASTQATAAEQAQSLQATEAQNALTEQQREYDQGQKNLAPYLATGDQALTKLNSASPFSAPTAVTEQNDPGYQFRLAQGDKALQNSAAARGSLLSGGTAKSLSDYAQGSASAEYGNVYNRALSTYNENQNTNLAEAGLGQNATSQANQLGTNLANETANIDLTEGQQQGQDINNAAAARASGYVGATNAIGAGVTGAGNSVLQGYLYSQISQNQNKNNSGYGEDTV